MRINQYLREMEGIPNQNVKENYIQLKQATLKDLPILYEITQSSMEEINDHSNINRSDDEKISHYQKYVNDFSPKIDNTFLIEAENKIIGRLRLEITESNIHIGGIQNLPKFQGRGVGSKIINSLKKHNKNITLMVHKVNKKAISFYQKHGFTIEIEKGTQFKMIFTLQSQT